MYEAHARLASPTYYVRLSTPRNTNIEIHMSTLPGIKNNILPTYQDTWYVRYTWERVKYPATTNIYYVLVYLVYSKKYSSSWYI